MEETREPQQPVVAPISYPPQPAYPQTQAPYYVPTPAPVAQAGRFTRMRRITRLLLRRLLYGATIAGRVLRPYALFLVVLVALLGVIGWMSYLLWGARAQSATFARADSLPPAVAVERFIQGQQNFNADMMWDAYSPDFQASQLANGATKATLQAQANYQRNQGLKFVRYDYIGGVKETDGGGMYFYSVDLRLRNQQKRFSMIFHADADGKITEIESLLAPQTGATTK
ncbi:MAG: hypothetical protein IPP13_27470 [Kouleothrix sp.]|nr:hypothetical protein [Kouleothrix sp.]